MISDKTNLKELRQDVTIKQQTKFQRLLQTLKY